MPKRIVGNIVGLPSPRSDWNQTDEMKADFIKNKPDIEKIENDIIHLKGSASDAQGFQQYADGKLQELEDNQDDFATKEEVGNLVTEITYKYDTRDNVIDGLTKSGIYKLVDQYEQTNYLFVAHGNSPERDRIQIYVGDETDIRLRYWDMTIYNGDYAESGGWTEWDSIDTRSTNKEMFATKDEVGNLVKVIDDIKGGSISVMNAFNAEFAVVAACDMYNNPIESTYATKDELYPTPLTTIEGTLGVDTSYNLGEQTELTLLFPAPLNDGAVIYITFESGETPTNLTVDTSYTTDFDLIPEANMGYEIYAKCNGRIWIVKYSEYEVV